MYVYNAIKLYSVLFLYAMNYLTIEWCALVSCLQITSDFSVKNWIASRIAIALTLLSIVLWAFLNYSNSIYSCLTLVRSSFGSVIPDPYLLIGKAFSDCLLIIWLLFKFLILSDLDLISFYSKVFYLDKISVYFIVLYLITVF